MSSVERRRIDHLHDKLGSLLARGLASRKLNKWAAVTQFRMTQLSTSETFGLSPREQEAIKRAYFHAHGKVEREADKLLSMHGIVVPPPVSPGTDGDGDQRVDRGSGPNGDDPLSGQLVMDAVEGELALSSLDAFANGFDRGILGAELFSRDPEGYVDAAVDLSVRWAHRVQSEPNPPSPYPQSVQDFFEWMSPKYLSDPELYVSTVINGYLYAGAEEWEGLDVERLVRLAADGHAVADRETDAEFAEVDKWHFNTALALLTHHKSHPSGRVPGFESLHSYLVGQPTWLRLERLEESLWIPAWIDIESQMSYVAPGDRDIFRAMHAKAWYFGMVVGSLAAVGCIIEPVELPD
jgi:hypothetical protein